MPLNFNLLNQNAPMDAAQAFQRGVSDVQTNEANALRMQQSRESFPMEQRLNALRAQTAEEQLSQYRTNRENLAQLQQALKDAGHDPDPYRTAQALIASGDPAHMKMGFEIKQTADQQRQFEKIFNPQGIPQVELPQSRQVQQPQEQAPQVQIMPGDTLERAQSDLATITQEIKNYRPIPNNPTEGTRLPILQQEQRDAQARVNALTGAPAATPTALSAPAPRAAQALPAAQSLDQMIMEGTQQLKQLMQVPGEAARGRAAVLQQNLQMLNTMRNQEQPRNYREISPGVFFDPATNSYVQAQVPEKTEAQMLKDLGVSGKDYMINKETGAAELRPTSKLYADTKKRYVDDRKITQTAVNTSDLGLSNIDYILDPKNTGAFDRSFGLTGEVTRKSPDDATRAMVTHLNQLSANMKLAGRNMMGKIGSITEREWPILEQQLAGITPSTPPAEARAIIQGVQNWMSKAKGEALENHELGWADSQFYKPMEQKQLAGSAGATTPSGPAGAPNGATPIPSAMDNEAMAWAKANPNDPRAARIIAANRR